MPNNNFAGTIPLEVGLMTKLKTINLKQNELSGNIPWLLGSLANLENFELEQNSLVGQIPEGICQKQLAILNVDCLEVACWCCTAQNCAVDQP